jgi:hypothetical protein
LLQSSFRKTVFTSTASLGIITKRSKNLPFHPPVSQNKVMGAAQSSPTHHQACQHPTLDSQISSATELRQKAAPCCSPPAISQGEAIGAVRTSPPHAVTPPNQTMESGISTTMHFSQRAPQPPCYPRSRYIASQREAKYLSELDHWKCCLVCLTSLQFSLKQLQ